MMSRFTVLGLFPKLILFFFCSAFLVGLAGTWLPSLGILPVIGARQFSLKPWLDLFQHYSFPAALSATLISGWGAALCSLTLAGLLTALCYQNKYWKLFQKSLPAQLSLPHAAFTVGFIFLIAPGGWLMRLVSPELSGFVYPPDWLTVKDPWGFSLMAVLILKETPFLLFIIISTLPSLQLEQTLAIGRSLGYSPTQSWLKLILPRLYPQLRLPFFAVLAYSLSVVDMALIIGPTAPPTLAALVLQWFHDPDLNLRLLGSAGACLLLLLVLGSILLVLGGEIVLKRFGSHWLTNGKRQSLCHWGKQPANFFLMLFTICSLGGFLVLIVWSLARRWRFPQALPESWTGHFWAKVLPRTLDPLLNTLSIGFAAASLGVILVIGCLEYELILKKKGKRLNLSNVMGLVYIPLLVPQIAFIFGVQLVLSLLRLDATWGSLVWSHLIFVLPYCFLTLAGTYRRFDDRYFAAAQSLCGSYLKSLLRIKLPMLCKPVIFTFAIGFSVSVAQYIPTLFIGGGRYTTLTIETVNLAAGSDRRVLAVVALCQLLLPLLVFCGAMLIPRLLFFNRKGMER